MEKFERLIEYVINDEEAKARELFHEIVVEKSRDIYESLMSEEDEELGGDAADDFIQDIESDEEGMSMDNGDEDAEDAMDMDTDDDESDEDDTEEEVEELEDRVVGVEDKLDELMAEFETLMTSENGEESMQDMDMDMDEVDEGSHKKEDDDIEESDEVLELDEALELQSAPKAKDSEESFVHSKSTVAANSGAKGIDADPVKMGDSDEKGRSAPDAKDMGHTTHIDKLNKAPSASDSEPSEVNTKSTLN